MAEHGCGIICMVLVMHLQMVGKPFVVIVQIGNELPSGTAECVIDRSGFPLFSLKVNKVMRLLKKEFAMREISSPPLLTRIISQWG
jgi:hypothetical protein